MSPSLIPLQTKNPKARTTTKNNNNKKKKYPSPLITKLFYTMSTVSLSSFFFFFFSAVLLCLITAARPARPLTTPSDIAALKAFKSSINPSSIPPWSCLATWNFAAADPCAVPRRTFFTCGLSCSADSTRVTQLTLDPAAYSGELTPLISKLTHLAVLDISDNAFHGPIPPSIAALSALQTLVLRSNAFSGAVPPAVTGLKNLQSLDLSYNSLTGRLPESLNSMSGLRRLDLSFNKIAGEIPKLPANLLEVALKGNALSGGLVRSSFDGATQLEVIELSENAISGALESWLFLLPSIQQVDLANNRLTRVDVARDSGISNLVAVDLGFNAIEGNVPVNFASYPLLSSLSLRHNRLHGEIPAEFSKKKSLRRLFLDGNFLSGKPPSGFFSSSTGETAFSGSLADNCLRGCPASSQLCVPSQKSDAVCKQAYGGKPRS